MPSLSRPVDQKGPGECKTTSILAWTADITDYIRGVRNAYAKHTLPKSHYKPMMCHSRIGRESQWITFIVMASCTVIISVNSPSYFRPRLPALPTSRTIYMSCIEGTSIRAVQHRRNIQ